MWVGQPLNVQNKLFVVNAVVVSSVTISVECLMCVEATVSGYNIMLGWAKLSLAAELTVTNGLSGRE